MENFVVIDCETTGLSPSKDKITEISAITADHTGNIYSSFSALLKWDIEIPVRTVELTGITRELLLQKGISPQTALTRIAEITAGKDIVSYNIGFDMGFLRAEADRLGIPLKHRSEICALEAARQAWPILMRHPLQATALWAKAGRPSHRATSDCLAALGVYCCARSYIALGQPMTELWLDEFVATAMDIEELRSCQPGTSLVLWSRESYGYINAYKETSSYGQGLVFRFPKDRNPALISKITPPNSATIVIDDVSGANISMTIKFSHPS